MLGVLCEGVNYTAGTLMETPVSSSAPDQMIGATPPGAMPNMLSVIPDLSIHPLDVTVASPTATTQVEVGYPLDLRRNCTCHVYSGHIGVINY